MPSFHAVSIGRGVTLLTPTADGTSGQVLKTDGSGNLSFTDAGGMSIGGAVSGGTAGSVLFVDGSGNLGQDNSNLFWDTVNGRLCVGDNTGSSRVNIKGPGSTSATSALNVTDNLGNSLLFVRDDGNVGIGTTGPVTRLDVRGATNSPIAPYNTNANAVGEITTITYAGSDSAGNRHNYAYAGMAIEDPTDGAEDGAFVVYTSSNNTWGERFRINNLGNVGIGTTDPSWKLEVAGMVNASNDGISTKVVAGAISDTSFSGTAHNGLLGIDSTNGRLYFRYGGAWHYVAQTAGVQVPADESAGTAKGDVLVPMVDRLLSDGALHASWQVLTRTTVWQELLNRVERLEQALAA